MLTERCNSGEILPCTIPSMQLSHLSELIALIGIWFPAKYLVPVHQFTHLNLHDHFAPFEFCHPSRSQTGFYDL